MAYEKKPINNNYGTFPSNDSYSKQFFANSVADSPGPDSQPSFKEKAKQVIQDISSTVMPRSGYTPINGKK